MEKEYRPYKITVILSGHTNNFELQADGSVVFTPRGNAKTSEKSAIQAVKRTAALCGCKVEKIVKIEKTEV